jgi:hypothetical protein
VKVAAGGVTDTQVAAANKDGAAGTASMRTLGTGATQAAKGSDAEYAANKGAVSGYAPLDGTSKVPIANLPTGTSSSSVVIGNDSRVTGAEQTANKGAVNGYMGLDGSGNGSSPPKAHAASHGYGGTDQAVWPIALPVVTGQYYTSQGIVSVTTAANPGNGTARYVPFWVPKTATFDRISIRTVTTPGSAGAVIRLGIYNDNGAGKPGSLLLDAGTIDATAAVGLQEITINQSLTAGLYWLVAVPQGAPTTAATTQIVSSAISNGPYNASAGTVQYGWLSAAAGVTGALPGTANVSSASTASFVVVLRAA